MKLVYKILITIGAIIIILYIVELALQREDARVDMEIESWKQERK